MAATSSVSDGLCVVLVATRNPLNIGAAARAMSNFGFRRLRVVNPYERAFREAKSAVGASALLKDAEEHATVADAVADCTLVVGTTAGARRDLQLPFRQLKEGARLIRKKLETGRVALLFGSEKRGLSNQDFSHCHWLLHIPTRQEHLSMNLGQAVAVCLYELARDARTAAGPDRLPQAAAGEVERVTALLLDVLHASGYVKSKLTAPTEEKIRRRVRRLNLSTQDIDAWLGMMRQMLWKMERTT